jgi:hypothetical protein
MRVVFSFVLIAGLAFAQTQIAGYAHMGGQAFRKQ